MISQTIANLIQNNSPIRKMFEEGIRLSAIHGKENVFDFSLGNPYFPAPEEVKQSVIDIIENTAPNALHGYMPNAGYPEVREVIAESLNKKHGGNYTGSNLVMTPGAAYGINIILKTILDQDDEVVTIAPYFFEYKNYVVGNGGKLSVAYATDENFQPDAEKLEKYITPKTKALIINSPNNPTGVIYSEESIKNIAEMLRKKQKEYGTNIVIISDEPYRELAFDGAKVPWIPNFYDNTLVVYSWSKTLSLPGQRMGYVLVHDKAYEAETLIGCLTFANRIYGAVNAPSLFQRVVAKCVDSSVDISLYDENRKLILDVLKNCGFDVIKPEGAFYLWLKAPDGDDIKFVEKAQEFNILLVPGSSFGGDGYVRLSYCVDPEMIKRSESKFRSLASAYGL